MIQFVRRKNIGEVKATISTKSIDALKICARKLFVPMRYAKVQEEPVRYIEPIAWVHQEGSLSGRESVLGLVFLLPNGHLALYDMANGVEAYSKARYLSDDLLKVLSVDLLSDRDLSEKGVFVPESTIKGKEQGVIPLELQKWLKGVMEGTVTTRTSVPLALRYV